MEKAKYIIFKDGSAEVFSKSEIHSWQAGGREVLSAGSVMLDENKSATEVFGESTTLGVKSRKEDLQILQGIS